MSAGNRAVTGGQIATSVVDGAQGTRYDRPDLDAARQRAADRGRSDSPLTALFPSAISVPAYFNQITVPAGLVGVTGQSAWFGLASVQAGSGSGQLPEFLWVGADLELVAADVNGNGISGQIAAAAGAGTALAWGDITGTSAAIVVGRDLPSVFGAWGMFGSPHVPGIELGSDTATFGAPDASTLLSPQIAAQYTIAQQFPPGRWDATPTPSVLVNRFTRLPTAQRFRQGQRLDVALVVSRKYVDNLATERVLCGRGSCRLTLVPMDGNDGMRP